MQLGLEVFLDKHTANYRNKNIGLLTNITGVNHQLESTIDLFAAHPDLNLTALYGPEHGIRGEAREGKWIESTIDPFTNVPVYSLYNKEKKPVKDVIDGVDVIFCDLQDIGSRYYTFIYTMANLMQACKNAGKEFVVLDRPNPVNGMDVEGNLVEKDFQSFVGQFPIPVRHGLTIGELAKLFNTEFSIHCKLEIIQMDGWARESFFDDTDLHWVSPTPNATNINMCLLYPGTCLIEGTNLSEGRGTTKPFEVVGAPFINGRKLAAALSSHQLDGVLFRPTVFQPLYQKFAGEICEGVQLHITDREKLKPYKIGVLLLQTLKNLYPDEVEFIRSEDFDNQYFLDLLAGTDTLRKQLMEGSADRFMELASREATGFENVRNQYLLYEKV